MTVRAISPGELKAFCALNDDGWLEDVIAGFWKGGDVISKPEWCFLLEDDAEPVGRVLFYHLPPCPDTLVLFRLHLDWKNEPGPAGMQLLSESLARMRATGARRVDRALYDIYADAFDAERGLYAGAGFRCIQEKKRYVWKVTGEPVAVPDRLEYRPMTETGEGAFVDAIRRVTVDTLDREDRLGLSEFGPERHAQRYMGLLRDDSFRPERFHLAFGPGGELCGLVAPARLDENEGTIGYVGVVPEQRGRGYGYDLVLKANAVLQPEGYKLVIAETDTHNIQLHAHLERAGYSHEGTITELRYEFD